MFSAYDQEVFSNFSTRYILKDYVNGKLKYCIAPPGADQSVYHTYAPSKRTAPSTTVPVHVRMTKERVLGTEDIDRDFFRDQTAGVGFKGLSNIGKNGPRSSEYA